MKQRKIFLLILLVVSFTSIGFKNPTDLFSKTEVYFSPEGQTEVYFSPEGRIKERLVQAISESKSSVDIAIFNFTSHNLRAALVKAKKRGVKIRVIADAKQMENDEHSLIGTLMQEGFEVKLLKQQGQGIMHNKFAIFDKKLLSTGSYNWTESAEHKNYENVLFLSSQDVIKAYQKEFDELWTAKN